jgi:hypothetical protein
MDALLFAGECPRCAHPLVQLLAGDLVCAVYGRHGRAHAAPATVEVAPAVQQLPLELVYSGGTRNPDAPAAGLVNDLAPRARPHYSSRDRSHGRVKAVRIA